MISNLSVRERLIQVASELFYSQGYVNTGINEIIEKAKVAKASLYSHFRTKDDLLIAYLNNREEQFMQTLRMFVDQQADGKEKVLAIFDFLAEFFNTEEYRGCWCVNTLSEIPKDNERVKSVIRMHKKNLRDYILEIIRAFNSESDMMKLSKQIYLLYEGAVMESYLQNDNWPIVEAKEIAKKII